MMSSFILQSNYNEFVLLHVIYQIYDKSLQL